MEAQTSNAVILEARNICKTYYSGPNEVEVLRGVNLDIFQAEIAVIMGASGVGKSTLLNILGTIDTPTAGQLNINGEDVFRYSEPKLARFRNDNIGFIFQFHHLLAEFTALENVLIPRMIKGNHWEDDANYASQLLSDVGLAHRLEHKPNQLSGGEQQRVAIARALMNRPQLIMADEPTGDLDRKNSQILFDLIRKLNEKYGHTFIIVTHDDMIARQAHRIIQLADGKIESESRPAGNPPASRG